MRATVFSPWGVSSPGGAGQVGHGATAYLANSALDEVGGRTPCR